MYFSVAVSLTCFLIRSSAPPSKQKSFLPEDKQFLVTKHVPSHSRAADFEAIDSRMQETEEDDGWTSTAFTTNTDKAASGPANPSETAIATNEPEEIIDIDLMDDSLEDEDDANIFNPSATSAHTTSPVRTYNLYISYSTSYRVPKFYLSGFNGQGSPLTPEEMFEDIMADYRNKTATIEKAPFEEDLTLVSIHPCRHASVMKTFLSKAENRVPREDETGAANNENGDDWEEIKASDSQQGIRVDQYLVVFLKFIASVTPGIEHDNTMSVL